MANELRAGLAQFLADARIRQDNDFLKKGVRLLSLALMELEIKQHGGASPHGRTSERPDHRNGYRTRSWDTRMGTVKLESLE